MCTSRWAPIWATARRSARGGAIDAAASGNRPAAAEPFLPDRPARPARPGQIPQRRRRDRDGAAPPDLLAALQEIERRLGRDRSKEIRWGPRTCDLDILLIDRQVIDTPELTVPHPRMHERRFMLEPLAEIAPDAMHPVLGKTVVRMLADLKGEERGADGYEKA